MFNCEQFKIEIVDCALHKLGLYSASARELLVLTCANETLGGTYIKQIEGPALGPFQMEPKSHEDLWNTYLPRRSDLVYKILSSVYLSSKPPAEFLKYNLLYAAMMARVFYYRFAEKLPDAGDVKALAEYYKKYWATKDSAATAEQAIINYTKFTRVAKPK